LSVAKIGEEKEIHTHHAMRLRGCQYYGILRQAWVQMRSNEKNTFSNFIR